MFTPEFISEDRGEFILVANHNLESDESVQASIKFNKARMAFGISNLPEHLQSCRLIYDIRGQVVSEIITSNVKQALEKHCCLEFKF